MIQWIISNIWTIIICAVLIGIVAAIIVSMVRKKRKGKSMVCNCGNCKNCAMHGNYINLRLDFSHFQAEVCSLKVI